MIQNFQIVYDSKFHVVNDSKFHIVNDLKGWCDENRKHACFFTPFNIFSGSGDRLLPAAQSGVCEDPVCVRLFAEALIKDHKT